VAGRGGGRATAALTEPGLRFTVVMATDPRKPRPMHIRCPSCQAPVASAGINRETGMAVCGACNEVFALPGWALASGGGAVVETAQPAGTRIAYVPSGDGFGIVLPGRDTRGLGVFFIIFGGIWVAFWGAMQGGGLHVEPGLGAQAPALIGALLLALGGGGILGGITLLTLRSALVARDRSVRLVRTVFGCEFVTTVGADEIREVVRVVRYSQGGGSDGDRRRHAHSEGQPVYGIALVRADGRRPAIGAGLSDDEIAWLRWLILDYCRPRA
jgi:hypothetical protein